MILSTRNICMVHFTLLNAICYKLLTAPADISGHGLVFILGRAMRLPDAQFSKDDPAIGLVVIVLMQLSIVDIAAYIDPSISFLSIAVPFRLTLSFIVSGVGYFSQGENIALSNSVVFTFSFLEVIFQFWLYVSVRDDRMRVIREQVPVDE
ncbi:increased loss of mitochondrial DNA protein 1 [Kockiozyma suomiensis]|uniref:increased loss of mitochondrial DNA protein 1 n=1 Tax=Kockiozyma suomiensis TaxID=1337062 RepID=UPI003343EA13